MLVLWLLNFLQWRTIFICFGMVGFIWVAVWHVWFRNDPSEHPSVNEAELQAIVSGRPPDSSHAAGWEYWGRLARSRNMIAMCIIHPQLHDFLLLHHVAADIPEAAARVRRRGARDLGGPSADCQHARRPARRPRDGSTRRPSTGCASAAAGSAPLRVIAGVALLAAVASSTPILAAGLIALATGMTMFTLGAAWGTVIEIDAITSASSAPR
jgi:hypothetical protein